MAILRARKTWKRAPIPKKHGFRLTPAEKASVRAALRAATRRYGSIVELAAKMGVGRKYVDEAVGRRARVGIGIALAFARAIGVPFEDVIAGRPIPT